MTATPSRLWLGIDLGTFNSSAAVKQSNNTVTSIRSCNKNDSIVSLLDQSEDHKNFPSFILFNEQGQISDIGMAGKEQAHIAPDRVVWGIKRLLGKTYTELKNSGELARFPYRIRPNRKNGQCLIIIGETSYTPEQLCTEIFKKIKADAEHQINAELNSVVVSVPAYFDPLRVSPIIDAAKAAGFINVKTIPEPVAAALAYNIEISSRPKKVMVFDLGAGTLDVTAGFLCLDNNDDNEYKFQVVKNTGDTCLGGMDMDDRISRLIIDKCQPGDLSKTEQIQIRHHAEIAKIRLSNKPDYAFSFTMPGVIHQCTITQQDLQTAFEGEDNEKNLLESARRQIMAAITEAGWRPQDIERLLIIGGPTRLPCIGDMLRIVFDNNRLVQVQIDEFYSGNEAIDRMSAVATGAALSVERRVDDNVPAGYGFENLEIDDDLMVHIPSILVPRDSSYPVRSKPQIINWTNRSGLFEFKILQQIPKSEIEQYGYEYKFVGIQKFAVKNPELCMISIQMGYNANKELEVTVTDILTGEAVTYHGVIQSTCIGMNYPLKVKRPPNINSKRLKRIQPDDDTIEGFTKWAETTTGYIQGKAESHPMPHMSIRQKLDEIGILLKKENAQVLYENLFTQINSLIWNANSSGIICHDEYIELANHLANYESELFQVAAA